MNFRSMIGQREVIGNLEYAIGMDRIGHAYIFCGPSGIGKRTVADIFAGLLLCDAPNGSNCCNICQACMLYKNGTNPDFHRITADGASIGVDEIRNIHRDIAIKPMYSKRKVYIIENADKMTVQAQNSLLKTLEEPPSYVVIILTVVNYESLLETIRSRSQRVSFKKNSYLEVRQAIIDRYGSGIKGIDFAATYADGVIGKALELVGAEDFISLRDKIFDMVFKIKRSGLSEAFNTFSFFDENKDDIDVILDIITMIYRDMLVLNETGNENILINSDKKDIIFNNARKYSSVHLFSSIELIEAARIAVKQNANYQLVIENLLIKLVEDS